MAGILGICGLIVGVFLVQKIKNDKGNYTFDFGFKHLAAGLCLGISTWAEVLQ